MTSPSPALSVIVVTPRRFAAIRKTVAHLRAQTISDRLELLIVTESEAAAADREPEETRGFAACRLIEAGPIANVDHASVLGILQAAAAVVAVVEDHAFPEPEWAERLLEAYQDPNCAGAAGTILNANPRSRLSWGNLLIAYGPWTEPAADDAPTTLPAHNVSYRRDVLLPYGSALADKVGRSGGLAEELYRGGQRFRRTPAARIAHLNPSRWVSTASLRFNAGRAYGAGRAAQAGWGPLRRALYVGGAPLIPALRLRRLYADFLSGGRRPQARRALLGIVAGLALEGVGEAWGYAFGPGRSADILAVFEMDRMQHLDCRDRRALNAGADPKE